MGIELMGIIGSALSFGAVFALLFDLYSKWERKERAI